MLKPGNVERKQDILIMFQHAKLFLLHVEEFGELFNLGVFGGRS
jgi:hypothetical protein